MSALKNSWLILEYTFFEGYAKIPNVEKNYVDSHGQSEVAFAFCHLLGFQLLPRLKPISSQRLYLPLKETADDLVNLQSVLTRPIRWHLIEQQYDEMVKFATALRLGTAETKAILRRFTRKGHSIPLTKRWPNWAKP